ncbi:MAG TPA: sigma-70 family RNA polymerase sigma factor [Rheinheimera sp.]|uniref:RNA polymerase sigma factor n=1 Tax=Rheinheimera sp. TaxID=1869214 RepID=UPI002F95A58E
MSITITEQLLMPDVAAAQNGDIHAFERLVSCCQRSVSSIALAIVKDLDASEDITQQVFIHIWQQLNTLQNPASFLPWVRQITRYRAFNYLRDNKVALRTEGDDTDTLLDTFSTSTELSDDLARAQQNQIMAEFISQLPEDSREIVLLFYREEQNSQQVAALLGLSEANVRKKLQRVRTLLKEQLLAKYGKLILTTAPGLGLTTAICTALSAISPPVAAATAASAASTSSGLSKFAALLGGAMLGAVVAVVAVIGGMHQPIKRATDQKVKQRLITLRNKAVIWVVSCGLLLTASYELTSGALAPVLAFAVFISGLAILNISVWQLLSPQFKQQGQRVYYTNLFWCIFGTVAGYGGGFAGVIIGLINSGRL